MYVYLNWASQVMLVVKNPHASAGDVRDVGLISGSGRPPGAGHGNPPHYSCLGNPMDRGAWWVHGVAKTRTQVKRLSTNTYLNYFDAYLKHCKSNQ